MKRFITLTFLILIASYCITNTSYAAKKIISAEHMYDKAIQKVQGSSHNDIEDLVEQLSSTYPFSVYTQKGRLLLIISHMLSNNYQEAVFAAETYLSLYTNSSEEEYVYYLIAISYFKQIKNRERNTQQIQNMIDTIATIKNKFPNSQFSKELKIRLEHVLLMKSLKTLSIGKYYASKGSYIAAINRYYDVLNNEDKYTPEALFRLVEAFEALSLNEESQFYSQMIKDLYPESIWVQELANYDYLF